MTNHALTFLPSPSATACAGRKLLPVPNRQQQLQASRNDALQPNNFFSWSTASFRFLLRDLQLRTVLGMDIHASLPSQQFTTPSSTSSPLSQTQTLHKRQPSVSSDSTVTSEARRIYKQSYGRFYGTRSARVRSLSTLRLREQQAFRRSS